MPLRSPLGWALLAAGFGCFGLLITGHTLLERTLGAGIPAGNLIAAGLVAVPPVALLTFPKVGERLTRLARLVALVALPWFFVS